MTAPPNRPPSEFAERWCTGHGISCDAATVMTEPMKVAVKREDMKEVRGVKEKSYNSTADTGDRADEINY